MFYHISDFEDHVRDACWNYVNVFFQQDWCFHRLKLLLNDFTVEERSHFHSRCDASSCFYLSRNFRSFKCIQFIIEYFESSILF